jgi:hypothetical protein
MLKRRYVSQIPKSVPEGMVLVHNHVKPADPIGMNGFRVWLQEADVTPVVVCTCGWAPQLTHYRVVRPDEQN